MTVFLQTVAVALVTVILCAVLSRQGRDMTVLLGLAACAMLIMAAFAYLEPVVQFLSILKDLAQMDDGVFGVILKAVGIGLTAEVATLICNDAGNAAIGKAVEIVSAATILYLSLPLMNTLLELVQQMVGSL